MRRFMDEFLRTLVFLVEVAGAVVIGIPLVLFGALCFSFLIYFVGFRALGQELRSLWKNYRLSKLIAKAPTRRVQPPRVGTPMPSSRSEQCCCNASWLDLDQKDCPVHGVASNQLAN